MTLLIVSTVKRRTPPTDPSGYIYVVDLDSQKILRKCFIVEAAYRGMDPNPRGGTRGSKGISIRDDQIAIANAMAIFRYDPQWNLLGEITHPLCAGIHDILFEGDTLWVTSARTDLLFQFDLSGKMLKCYNMREPSPALKSLGWKPPIYLTSDQISKGSIDYRDPRTHSEEESNNAHVNSVGISSDGSILISLGFVIDIEYAFLLRVKSSLMRMGVWPVMQKVNQQFRKILAIEDTRGDNPLVIRPAKARSAVVRIHPDGRHSLCLIIPNAISPSHSLLVLPDETVIYLDTTGGTVVHFNPVSGEILSTSKVTDGFLRGVTIINDRTLVLGSNAELITFDLARKNVIQHIQLTKETNEFVYDLEVLPSHYFLPPVSFENHFLNVSGYRNIEALIEERRLDDS